MRVNLPKLLSLLILLTTALTARAQQTIFQVPTGDIAIPGGVFIQQQIDLGDAVQSQTTIDIGLGSCWEAGLNLLDLELAQIHPKPEDPANPGLPPAVMANLQKSFGLVKDKFLFSLGTQQGVALGDKALGRYTFVNWGLFELTNEAVEGLEVVAGAYHAHWNMAGNGDKFHGMIGAEYELLKPLHLSAEWLGGDNQVGATTLGVTIFALPKLPLAVGYRIPNTSRGPKGLTFQLSAFL